MKNVTFDCKSCKCAAGIKNVPGLLSERFFDSLQRNLVFMTAKAHHTVKNQTYLH